MKNITGNHGGLFSRGTAGVLVLLLLLAGWTPATAAWKIRLDWSKVQAVKPGTPMKVVLYQDQAPRESRKIRGRFQSANDDSLTLKMEYGPMRTLQKSSVRKVLVHRPLKKRYQVWVAAAVGTALWASIALPPSHDFSGIGKTLIAGIIAVPIGFTFLLAPKMGGIYNVPPKHRMQPPADKPYGSQSKAPEQAGRLAACPLIAKRELLISEHIADVCRGTPQGGLGQEGEPVAGLVPIWKAPTPPPILWTSTTA